MGEALIIRSGGGKDTGGWIPKTELITVNQNFIVPKAKGQQFSVRIFGGGGGACYAEADSRTNGTGGGGGGNMNYAVLTLNEGEIIPIIIGNSGEFKEGLTGYGSGYKHTNGGTTSFGSYISATGGECSNKHNGGNGGTGGGGGWSQTGATKGNIPGGHGYYGGGGGGGRIFYSGNNNWQSSGGNGGTYGGGGGGAIPGISTGGWGNGGNNIIDATDGLNTINQSAKLDFVGNGICGQYLHNTWSRSNNMVEDYIESKQYCGGGGYGGSGGNSYRYYVNTRYAYYSGGGGGGYGAKGGDAGYGGTGGGGGGWGNDGEDGTKTNSSLIKYNTGGGGGGYGFDGWGHGGSGSTCAKQGICIISYMQPVT